jgi:hypothetical protein
LVYGPFAPPTATPAAPAESDPKTAVKKQLPGIPFYNHYGVCTQETVWLEPQTIVSLTVTPDGGKPVTQTITLNNRAFHDDGPTQGHDANNLIASLQAAQGKHPDAITDGNKKFCPANVALDWAAIRDAYKVGPIDETSPSMSKPDDIATNVDKKILVRVSNTADIGTAVDYSRVYYINAQSPLIGTGTVDAKLNPDGTLGEGSASVDDETLSSVLTAASAVGSAGLTAWSTVAAAGITAAASAVTPVAAPAILGAPAKTAQAVRITPPACEEDLKDGWPEVKKSVEYSVTITPAGFKHDHKKVTPLDTGGSCLVSPLLVGGSYTITPVGDSGKPDKDAIGVSGSITLPKPKGGK